MYQILVKIPKEHYEDEQPKIIKELQSIEPKMGQISVSNNEYCIYGYINTNNYISKFSPVKEKYPEITVKATKIIEETE